VSVFAGQVVVVTGGARGLGRGISRAFAERGADVVLCDVNEAGAKETARALSEQSGREVTASGTDVSDPEQVTALIANVTGKFGRIDHLINNAGVVAIASITDTDPQTWDRVLAVNLRGVFLLTRAVLPVMLRAGSGSIVNIASQAGKRPNKFIAAYNASKAAVISLTRTTAVEAAPTVRANCVCPGFIDTELQEEEYGVVSALTGQTRDEIRQSWLDAMPLGRIQTVEEVADAVMFLASPAASQITGEALNVSGGLVME
jgi:meso-butanediol dehydrogenase / (S,S)-butanediol dehydrogenase / diacetyl reductase